MKTTFIRCNILPFMLLLVACSAVDDGIGEPGDTLCPIAPVTQLPGITAEVSRSADANYDVTFFRVDAAKQWNTDGSFNSIYSATYDASATSSFPATVSVSGSTAAMTIDPIQYYQLNDCSTKMFAVHPVLDGEKGVWNAVAGTVTYSIDGQTDIMVTNVGESKRKGTQPTLTFTHQLSKINVKLYAEDAEAVAIWGNVQVQAIDLSGTCVVTYPVPNQSDTKSMVTFSGSTNLNMTPEPVELTATHVSKAHAIDAGTQLFHIRDRFFTLRVVSDSGMDASLPIRDESDNEVTGQRWQWEPGKSYTIYLKLSKGKVWFDVQITPWITEGNSWGETELQ